MHPAPREPLGGEPTMARDSLVCRFRPMNIDLSSTDLKLWPEHQRLFFLAEACVTVTVTSSPYTLLFTTVLCYRVLVQVLHTYSTDIASPNLRPYLFR